ncbi:acetyl-CoA C-acyltransferase, partial [Klebsiella pneumoniae]|nr:acetyl-CoA C-acyltransferase [Klebsiella pneumoniae]
YAVSREDQDGFALASHQKALAAIAAGRFAGEILPYTVRSHLPDLASNTVRIVERVFDTDEGPRADSSAEGLAKLRPVFAARGSV